MYLIIYIYIYSSTALQNPHCFTSSPPAIFGLLLSPPPAFFLLFQGGFSLEPTREFRKLECFRSGSRRWRPGSGWPRRCAKRRLRAARSGSDSVELWERESKPGSKQNSRKSKQRDLFKASLRATFCEGGGFLFVKQSPSHLPTLSLTLGFGSSQGLSPRASYTGWVS